MGFADSNSAYICCAQVCVKKHLYDKRPLLVLKGTLRGLKGRYPTGGLKVATLRGL